MDQSNPNRPNEPERPAQVGWPQQTLPVAPGPPPTPMDHAKKAGRALLDWWRAATLDALLVGILWFIGLELLHVPLAPLWALLGAFCQFVPNVGGMLALIGPSLSLLFTRPSWEEYGLLLCLYAVIVVMDQLVILPLLLKKIMRVPIWAAIFGPIVLGILIPFWGVLIAPPLMAIIFAFRHPKPPRRP